ncbi:MAG: glycosyltransferase family 32 protein [Bacteroides nordii]
MIPKIIHYCWFGRGKMPELALKCLESWKKHLPDYVIKEWNEDNFDLDAYPYAREAYDNRKFAFVTDIVRLYALYHEGGIYMDTDVEVLKPLDIFLKYDAVSGFESKTQIPTGLMACREGYPLFKELLDEYDGIHFKHTDGSLDFTTNVVRITNACLKYGLIPNNRFQTVNGFTLFPKEYFCPKSYDDGKIYLTENTVTIHHFAGSWLTPKQKITERAVRMIGNDNFAVIVRLKKKLFSFFGK